jgi:hypothetical protein
VRIVFHTGKPRIMSAHNNVSWEVVVTAGFELDVLRGKLPYRPTIWVKFYAVPVG